MKETSKQNLPQTDDLQDNQSQTKPVVASEIEPTDWWKVLDQLKAEGRARGVTSDLTGEEISMKDHIFGDRDEWLKSYQQLNKKKK